MFIYSRIIIFLAAIFLNRCNCTKFGGCNDDTYSFEIFAKVFPDSDSITVNYTVWIQINESTALRDAIRDVTINYSDAVNLGTAIGFGELLGNSQSRDAANDFVYILIEGIETNNENPERFREYLFKGISGHYVFKLGIIPKKSGIFRIGLSGAGNVYRKNQSCQKAFFNINIKETNQHLYFNEWNFGVVPPLPNSMYCFKVK